MPIGYLNADLFAKRSETSFLNILYVETFGTSPFDVRFKGNEGLNAQRPAVPMAGPEAGPTGAR